MAGSLEDILNTTEVEEMKLNKAIVFADRHTGLECVICDKILKKYIKKKKKDIKYIIDLGDGIDNPFMSTFPVSPNYTKSAQEEFDLYASFWKDIDTMVPKATKVIIPGNHDKSRLDNSKTLNRGLASLRCIQYENVMKDALRSQNVRLETFKFPNTTYQTSFTRKHKAIFTHGDPRMNVNIKGGVTGHRRTAELYPFDGDIFMGHVHRFIQYPRAYPDKNLYTLDMMADKDKMKDAYLNHNPYTNGFMVIKYNGKKGLYSVSRYEIKNGMSEIDGKIYKGGK